jgi:hypothetical protein
MMSGSIVSLADSCGASAVEVRRAIVLVQPETMASEPGTVPAHYSQLPTVSCTVVV